MKKLIFALSLVVGFLGCNYNGLPQPAPNPTKVAGLYTRDFGGGAIPVIFIHAGPNADGGPAPEGMGDSHVNYPSTSSLYFEAGAPIGMAEKLADNAKLPTKYFVVTYDQRGQGRSDDARTPADYTYRQSTSDINKIIEYYHMQNPVLIGHGNGGIIALKYDELNMGVVRKIILVDTALDVFQSLTAISTNCEARYLKANDTTKVSELKSSMLALTKPETAREDQLDNTKKLFAKADSCGRAHALYRPETTTPEALKIYQMVDWLKMTVSKSNSTLPLASFMANEDFIHVNMIDYVSAHNDHIAAMYGDEDGLLDANSLAQIQVALAASAHPDRFAIVKGAGFNSFVDQPDLFLSTINGMLPTN